MGYRIKAKDIIVEVDTLDEARGVLTMLGALQGKTKAPDISKEPSHVMPLPFTDEAPIMATQMADFYRNLPQGHTRTIIEALYDNPEGFTRDELKKIVNLDGPAFGGALGGPTNAAKSYGLKGEDIVSKPKEGETNFQLTPSMREVIRTEKEKPKPIPYTS